MTAQLFCHSLRLRSARETAVQRLVKCSLKRRSKLLAHETRYMESSFLFLHPQRGCKPAAGCVARLWQCSRSRLGRLDSGSVTRWQRIPTRLLVSFSRTALESTPLLLCVLECWHPPPKARLAGRSEEWQCIETVESYYAIFLADSSRCVSSIRPIYKA